VFFLTSLSSQVYHLHEGRELTDAPLQKGWLQALPADKGQGSKRVLPLTNMLAYFSGALGDLKKFNNVATYFEREFGSRGSGVCQIFG
jgi:hypothetical protein